MTIRSTTTTRDIYAQLIRFIAADVVISIGMNNNVLKN